MSATRILRLKNFQTAARMTLQSSQNLKPKFGSRSLTLVSQQTSLKLFNKEPELAESTTTHSQVVYSDDEVETVGPAIIL